MNGQFSKNIKSIYEANDKAAYAAIKSEIVRAKGAQARLDAIVDSAIKAGGNMIINSLSLNRLNSLCLALADCKENSRLARLARVPEYLRIQGIAYNKEHKIFIFTDYAMAKASAKIAEIPSINYSDWLKNNKVKKEVKTLTEKQATQNIYTLYKAMRASVHITDDKDSIFQDVMLAMQRFVENNPAFQAEAEIEKLRNIIG